MPKPTRLKLAIVGSGMTMREVAARIGKHDTQVVRWANDARPVPPEVRVALALVLGTTVDALWPPEPEDVAA